MRKLLKSIACFATAALVGTGALADYGWYDGSISIGNYNGAFSGWSGSPDSPTDLGVFSDLTVSSVAFNIWSDANDRGGANMYFRVYDANGQVGDDQDIWLGGATRIAGDHDFSISYSTPVDLAAATGLTMEEGKTYYVDMWAKSYGDSGDEWYSNGGANYHAKFVYATHQTVTFDANGGRLLVDEFPAQYQYEVGKPYGVLGKAKLDDHARTGWFTEATGGDQVTEETIVDSAEPLTLYAQWTTDQVVTFDATGGECDELTRTVTVGQKYGKLPTPKWTAHVFLGWFTEEEGGKQLTRSSKVTTKPTRTMYAQWTDEQTVTFDAAGGSCDEPTRTVQIGGKYGKLPTPTWTGHVFLGWFSAPENGKQLTRGSKVTEKAARTMYAYWTDKQLVTFEAHGGECDPATKEYTIGGKYKTLPTPTWLDHDFLGWYTDAVNGRKLGPGSIVTPKATRSMHAYWTEADAAPAAAGLARASKAARDASTIFSENFTNFTAAGSYVTTVSTQTVASGTWLYENVIFTPGGAASGAGSKGLAQLKASAGYLYLPSVDNPATLTVVARASSGNLTLQQDVSGTWTTIGSWSLASSGTEYTHTFTNAGSATALRFVAGSKATYIHDVSVTGGSASGQSVTLSPSGPIEAEVGDVVEITASADGFSGDVTWSWTGSGTPNGNKFTVDTSAAVEHATITATATYGTDESASQSVIVTVTTPKHTITIDSAIENGEVTTTPSGEAAEGATVTVNASPAAGYQLGSITVNGVALADGVNTFTMPTENVTVSATFVVFDGDVLTRADTGATSSSYVTWTFTGTSGTEYAGNSAGGNDSIQLRKDQGSGIVITNSTGRDVASVTVDWNSNTVAARTNLIYGKKTPYASPADLHGDAAGTLLGEIARDATTFAVPEGYPYIGILAKGGAVYLDSVSIAFAALPPSVTLSPSGTQEVYVGDPAVTITATAENFSGPVTWSWTVNGTPVDGYTAATYTVGTSVAEDYVITATATDGTTTKTSDPVTVKVKPLATAHDVEIETDGNGTLTADPNPAMEGQTVTLTAVPNEGYRLDSILSDDVEITNMSFVMPDDDVYLAAFFEGKHDVVIDDQIVNGSVEASPTTAFSDETVTLTVQPDEGYELGTLTVLDGDLNEIPVTDMSFVMPKGDAYVFATFAEILPHDVVIFTNGVGTVEADVYSAYEGTTVTLTVTPGAGYKLDSIVVDDEPITGLSFVMPDDDVAVEVTFVEQPDMYFQFEANDLPTGYAAASPVLTNTGSTAETILGVEFAIVRACRGNGNTDKKVGTTAMRLAPTNNADAVVVNAAAFENDISKVSFQYAIFGTTDGIESVVVEVSADGDDWEELVDLTSLATTNLQTYVNASVDSGMKFIRFKATSTSSGNNRRFNVDEIKLWFAEGPQYQTVTFDPNGGRLLVDEFPAVYQYEVGKPYGVLGKAKLDDHARTGWFTQETGGTQVTEETIVDSAEPLTLYAQWTTDQVVTFDATGGECDELTRTVTVGQKYGKLPTPKWTAHVFLGWFTEEEGGKQLTRSSKVTTKPTRTMYAQWTDEQTVTFDAAGGSCDEPTRTVQIGGKYGKLPTPTWADHVFLGWFSAPENGKQLTRSSKVTEKAERTMYAYWTDQQTVTFNANGGECDPVTKVYTIGGKYKTLPTPTLDGQVFLGWYTDAVNGRKLGPGSIVILKAERTMYAYWGDERDALSVGMSITSFSMKNAGITAARDSRGSAAPVLTFEAVAGRTYELQWAQTLDGEWTVLKSWTAAENGETSVAVPADSAVGFFRLSTSSAVK